MAPPATLVVEVDQPMAGGRSPPMRVPRATLRAEVEQPSAVPRAETGVDLATAFHDLAGLALVRLHEAEAAAPMRGCYGTGLLQEGGVACAGSPTRGARMEAFEEVILES